MLWAFLSHGNLSLTSKNFKFVSQQKVNPFVVRPITIRKGVGAVSLESEGVEVQMGLKPLGSREPRAS
jgi:hypothetical protein